MTTKQMELLAQYFAGEQLDQIISLISLMRSQDKTNYEIGLMYMKELKLYSTFIKMLDEYYGKYIELPLTSDPLTPAPKGYDGIILDFTFNINEYNVFGVNGTFVNSNGRYFFALKQEGEIVLPLFLSYLGVLYINSYCETPKECICVNGDIIDYHIGQCKSYIPIKTPLNTLGELIIIGASWSKINLLSYINVISTNINSLIIDVLELQDKQIDLTHFKGLTHFEIYLDKDYDGEQIVFPDSVRVLRLSFTGFKHLELSPLIGGITLLPNLEKLTILSRVSPVNLEFELENFIWDEWMCQYKRKS